MLAEGIDKGMGSWCSGRRGAAERPGSQLLGQRVGAGPHVRKGAGATAICAKPDWRQTPKSSLSMHNKNAFMVGFVLAKGRLAEPQKERRQCIAAGEHAKFNCRPPAASLDTRLLPDQQRGVSMKW